MTEPQIDERAVQAAGDDEEFDIGELQVAEYLLFLMAFDTYAGHLAANEVSLSTNPHGMMGLKLLKVLDMRDGPAIQDFLIEKSAREVSKKTIARTFRVRVSTPVHAARRALTLRTVLTRGGAATLKAIFEVARARKAVKNALAAHVLDDPASALGQYAAVPIQNVRLKAWIRKCVVLVQEGGFDEVTEVAQAPSAAIEAAADAATDAASEISKQQLLEEGQTQADDVREAQDQQAAAISQVQEEATEAAREMIELAGDSDEPPTRSEVVGIATAAAVAALADSGDADNIPPALRGLDPEQRAAALTDGRVLVAAGAGAGKSFTLVRRVQHLVQDRGVDPSRILVSSFNKVAADELLHKISRALGEDAASRMTVGTLHGTFRKAIIKYGTPEEQAMFQQGFVGTGAAVARAVNGFLRKCNATYDSASEKWEDAEVPSAKQMMMFQTRWASNDVSPEQAMREATSDEEREAAKWYEMYLGFKGDLGPGWSPPRCSGAAREAQSVIDRFDRKYREKGGQKIRLGTFDDMISVFRDILKRSPEIRQRAQKAFDHIMIDEAQDLNSVQSEVMEMLTEHIGDGSDGKSFWMVGDPDQCVSVDTPVQVSFTATKRAGDLVEGDVVLSYRNGDFVEQVVRATAASSWEEGYQITTESGKTLTMSPNHKIWATPPYLSDASLVYLMHRPGFGFRVGVTNKTYADTNPFGGRPTSEGADRLWILSFHAERSDALLMEASVSYEFGVPTQVFNGEGRGINQDYVNAIFQKFGSNGERVLEAFGLSFDHPNWMACGTTRETWGRRVINLVAHSAKNTQVRLEWSGAEFDTALAEAGISFTTTPRPNYRRIRKYAASYRDGLKFARTLQAITGASIRERLSVPGEERPLPLITAAGVVPGMSVVVLDHNGFPDTEIVTSVEKVRGSFIDIDVDDASNFIGGGILSHNSVYSFRGARPELFIEKDSEEGWETRLIRTNYRCPPEVIDHANRLIAHNEDRLDKEANPNPSRARGESSIVVRVPEDEAAAAIETTTEIKAQLDAEAAEVSDFAVLCRTNKELHAYETALLMRGVPYARKGASSFLGAPETKAFLGYIALVTGTDAETTQKALADVLNKPNRFFIGPEKAQQAVDFAINAYARSMGVTKSSVDVTSALRDRSFREALVQGITGQRGGFKFDKSLEKVEDLQFALEQLALLANDENATTQDLFEGVLDMPGIKFDIDPGTGRIRGELPTTLREDLQGDLKDNSGGDDESDEEDGEESQTRGLGNIAFLFELAKPDENDPGDEVLPPTTPRGFWAKMQRLQDRAKELRVDIQAWEAEQKKLDPEDRRPPPGVYLGTAHCSPADEPVLTTEGWVPIGDLDPNKHRLASYIHTCNQLFWGSKGKAQKIGYAFVKESRPYKGSLVTLTTERSRTRVTPDHRIRVKLAESFYNKYVVYLMRRGDWWRVGMCRSAARPYKSGDLSTRLSTEAADAAWILGVYEDRTEALLQEARIQAEYGIPGLTFEVSGSGRVMTAQQMHEFHDGLVGLVAPRAIDLLESRGLDPEDPIYYRSSAGRGSGLDKRSSFTIRARNFLSGYMTLPAVRDEFVDLRGPRTVWTKPDWLVASSSVEGFEGEVFSLNVIPHRYYVSGGVVVHNSTKGAQWPSVYVQMPGGMWPMAPREKPVDRELTLEEQAKMEAELRDQMESERRLAYVALTRPSETLRVVSPQRMGGRPAGLSPFIAEAGLVPGENVEPAEGEAGEPKTATWVEDGQPDWKVKDLF